MAQRKLPLQQKRRKKKVKVKSHDREIDLGKLPPRDSKGRFRPRRTSSKKR